MTFTPKDSLTTAADLDGTLSDFDDNLNMLLNSDYSNFDHNLKRFLGFLRQDKISSSRIATLPHVDFEPWYEDAKKTVGGMAGSGTLSWPDDINEEMALRLSLLEYIFSKKEDVVNFCRKFMYAGTHYDESVQKFNEQIIIPFSIDFRKLLKKTPVQETAVAILQEPEIADSSKVFVVHGHDNAAKEEVARFLEFLKLTPIILHEQPNKGLTTIEKLEHNSIVGFAVVLLTPDDFGGQHGHAQQPRARQNVILELGFFIGKLGRPRVVALYKEGVEIPSDFRGVLYIPLDNQKGWKMELAKELKAVGMKVDMNLLFA